MRNLLVVVLLCCVSLSMCQRRERIRKPVEVKEMSLGFFRSSGLFDAMANKTKFFDKFLETSKATGGIKSDVIIDVSGNSQLKGLGSTKIASLERSELEAGMEHAGCGLYDKVVEIPNDKSNVLLYPSCVVLKHCGGCSGHPSLACKPTATRNRVVEVVKYIYNGKSALPDESADLIQLVEHTHCEPQCKITKSDCTPELHKFDDWDCKCLCKRQRQNCASHMRWDEDICACRCANVQKCGSGFKFDMLSCGCQPDRERAGDIDKVSRITVAPPTVAVCGHLRCPRRYKAQQDRLGTCSCKFDRDYYKKRGRF